MTHHAQQPGTPDLLALHELEPHRYPFLLQSVAGHPVSGRYDLLFGFPQWDSLETVREGADFFCGVTLGAIESQWQTDDKGADVALLDELSDAS